VFGNKNMLPLDLQLLLAKAVCSRLYLSI
jgi:hypothetical protein